MLRALLLQGKDKPTFSPWKDSGDVVVVKNARHVDFTGRKWEQKVYRWHTGCGRLSCVCSNAAPLAARPSCSYNSLSSNSAPLTTLLPALFGRKKA